MASHQRFQRFTLRRQNNHRIGGQPGHRNFPSQLPTRHATAPSIQLLFCCRKAASLRLPSHLQAGRSRNFRSAVLVLQLRPMAFKTSRCSACSPRKKLRPSVRREHKFRAPSGLPVNRPLWARSCGRSARSLRSKARALATLEAAVEAADDGGAGCEHSLKAAAAVLMLGGFRSVRADKRDHSTFVVSTLPSSTDTPATASLTTFNNRTLTTL